MKSFTPIRLALALTATLVILQLTGCSSGPIAITDSRTAAADAYKVEQKSADEYRKHGELVIGAQAQQRADEQYEQSKKKYSGFLEWLLDTAFTTWLNSITP